MKTQFVFAVCIDSGGDAAATHFGGGDAAATHIRTMKKHILALLLLLACQWVCADAWTTTPDEWTPAAGLQYNMTLYAQVLREDGSPVVSEGSRLVAFGPDGGCLGVAEIIDGPSGKLFSLLVCSDSAAGPSLAFQVLDGATGEIHDLQENVAFASDAILPDEGGLSSPMPLHIVSPRPILRLILMPGWNLVGLTRTLAEDGAEAFLALNPMALEGGGYVQCTVPMAGRSYWVFSRLARKVNLAVEDGAEASTTAISPGWSLVVYAEGCAWPKSAISIWSWEMGRFAPTTKESLEAGRAYLVELH